MPDTPVTPGSDFNAPPPATMAGSAGACPAFDQAGSLERVDGDLEILTAVIDAFCENGPTLIESAWQSSKTGDLGATRRTAHTLKGAAATAGATALWQSAMRLENASRDADLRTVMDVMQSLESQFAEFRRAVDQAMAASNPATPWRTLS